MLQEQPVAAGPQVLRHDAFQRLFGVVRRFGLDPAQPVCDTVHVRVDTQRRTCKRVDEDTVRRFASHAGQCQQRFQAVGDLAAEFVDEHLGE